MNRRYSQLCNYTLVNDWQLDNQRFDHTLQDMDLGIYCVCKLDLKHNRYLKHILVYNLHMDFQNTQVNIDMLQHRFVLYK